MSRHRNPAACGCSVCLRFLGNTTLDPSRYCPTYGLYRQHWRIPLPDYITETLKEAGLD